MEDEYVEYVEYVQVKRPVINKRLMDDLNIRMYTLPKNDKDIKDNKDNKDTRESPWKDFTFVLSKTVKKDKILGNEGVYNELKRNEGFYILANKVHISRHLKKTKFCNIFIQEGSCNRKICNFAHNMEEYNFPNCAFRENCKVKNCKFKHPNETLDEFKNRINFKLPNNIK